VVGHGAAQRDGATQRGAGRRQARRAVVLEEMVRLLFERGALAEGLRLAEECKTLFERKDRPREALALLDALGVVESPEDAAVIDRVRAQGWFDLGEVRRALDILAPYDKAPTLEAWTQILALRLRAELRLGLRRRERPAAR
jgi:hypothetical protein